MAWADADGAGHTKTRHSYIRAFVLPYDRTYKRLNVLTARAALKALEIVADRHGQSQKFFQRLTGGLEFDGNSSGFQADTQGKVLEFLAHYGNRRFHQKTGLLDAFFAKLGKRLSNPAPAPDFVMSLFSRGKAPQVTDQAVAFRQSIRADMVAHTGREDLLGPPAADTQEEFHRGAIDKRAGKGLEILDDLVELADPTRLCRHGFFSMLVRTCAECKLVPKE
jgi:hypothetical protein